MGIEVIQKKVEDKVDEVKASVDELIEKAEGRVELAKKRIPWKGLLIFLGVATLAALAIRGLVY